MSEPSPERRARQREGETTLSSGLQGIAYVVLMAALVGLVGFALALVVSWIY